MDADGEAAGSEARFADLAERLHAEVAAEVGLGDFGADDYRTGLAILLDALDAGPSLSPAGRGAALGLIRGALAGRLYTQEGWRLRPECLERPLIAPVVIMGVPRSGTTALHKLLAMDPRFQGLERWIRLNPIPRPPQGRWADEPLYKVALAVHEARVAAAPEADRAHHVHPDDPDECLAPMAQSFVSNWFGSNLPVPAYDDWFYRQDETASYTRYRDVLRLIGVDDDRRWLLKNPSHIMGIDGLLNAFPDACVVHTVRHPAETLSSLTNLLANIRGPLMGQTVDRAAIARREVAFWAEAARRAMAAEERRPDRIMSVDFRAFLADPMAVVRGVYDRFGIELTPEAEARMRRWAEANPQGKHGEHRYARIEGEDIDAAFADYIDRYGL
jgi:hypothetical protein